MITLFKTQYDSHDRVYVNPGNPIKTLYSPRYTDRGVLELVESGQENLYEYIQSHAQSVDIHYLLSRFVNGEVDVLSRAQGFYMDSTGLPRTYAEILNSVLAGEEAFNGLPAEIKREFNNSFSEWLAAMEDDDFAQRMGFKDPPAADVKPDVAPAGVAQDFVRDGAALAGAPAPATGGAV